MFKQSITISLTVGLVLVGSTSVLAGSSASNTHTVRHSRGHGQTDVQFRSVVNGVQKNISNTVKIDAVGENAGVHLNYNGKFVTGGGFANNIENPDPFVIFGSNTQVEQLRLHESTAINSFEKYNFNETSTTYELNVDN